MIVEWLLSLVSGLLSTIASMFPEWEPPTWMEDVTGSLQQFLDPATGLGGWVNFGVLSIVATAVLGAWVIGFAIKLFLRAGSHVPQFGGAG